MTAPGEHTIMMRNRPFPRRGFTLIELVASMAVMSILMVALGSVMILAAQAIPESGNPAAAMVEGGLVTDDIVGDLYCALSFTERSAKAVEFTWCSPPT